MRSRQLKLQARQIIFAPRHPRVIFVTALYLLVSVALTQIMYSLSDIGQYQSEMAARILAAAEAYARFNEPQPVTMPAFGFTVSGLFFFVVPWLFLWIMNLGYIFYARGIAREEALGYRSLIEGFNYFFKVITIRILQTLAIFVGLVLFLVPGLVVMAMFSQVNLLLLDHPEKNVFWFFGESNRIMRGKKWAYLRLWLSFFGWFFLSTMPMVGVAVQVWYIPYSTFSYVGFYHKLTGQGPAPPDEGWQRPGMF